MPNYGNVIVKVSYTKSGAGEKRTAEFNARYIGTRTGTDMTRTDEDIKLNSEIEKLRTKVDGEIYTNYIGRRPGVAISDDVDHGLFDRHGTANMTDVCNELRSLNHTQAMKMIISLSEEDAAALSIITKAQWEALIRKTMPQVGVSLDIPPSRLGWVAAYHPKEGHPHCHLIIWDKADKARHGNVTAMTKKELTHVKRAIAGEVFNEERTVLYAIKNEERNNIRRMAIEDVASVVGGNSSGSVMKPSGGNENWIREALVEISKRLPGHGSAKYAYMPSEVKDHIRDVVEKLIKDPRFSNSLKSYLDAHEALTRNYVKDDVKIQDARDNALLDLKQRLYNVVVDGAMELRNAQALTELHRNEDKVRETALPHPDNGKRLESVIRSKVEAGESKEEIVEELKMQLKDIEKYSSDADTKAEEIVEKATEKDFTHADWKTVSTEIEDDEHDEEIHEQAENVEESLEMTDPTYNVKGTAVFNAVDNMLHAARNVLRGAHHQTLADIEKAHSGKDKFVARKIIGTDKQQEKENALFRPQDLEI